MGDFTWDDTLATYNPTLEFWATETLFQPCTCFGGYARPSEAQKILKENLLLNKRSRQWLARCSKASSDVEFKRLRSELRNTPEQFLKYFIIVDDFCSVQNTTGILSLVRREAVHNVLKLEKWVNDGRLDTDFTSFFNQKEKISIDKDGLALLSSIKFTEETQNLEWKPLSASKTLITKFSIERGLRCRSKIFSNKAVDFKPMPNKIDRQIEEIYDEKLSRSVYFFMEGENGIKFKKLHQCRFYKYLIDQKLTKLGSNAQNINRSAQMYNMIENWSVTNPSTNKVLVRLEAQCKEESFSNVIFYKVKQPHIKRKTTNTRDPSLLFRSVKWRLYDGILKAMKWDPFQHAKHMNISEILDSEPVENVPINVPVSKFTFNKIRYNSIEFLSTICESKTTRSPIGDAVANNTMQGVEDEDSVEGTNPQDSSSSINLSMASILPAKRSFIDDNLKSLIEKRRSKSQSTPNSTINIPSMELLGITTNHKENETVRSNVSLSSPTKNRRLDKAPSIEYNPELNGKCILLNWHKVNENYQLLQHLSKFSEFTIIERELPYGCDFILSSSVCIVRIQIQKFFQVTNENELFYASTLAELHQKFTNVIALVEYTETIAEVDSDLFFKVQLMLQVSGIQCFMVNDVRIIAQWILDLAVDSPLYDESFDDISDDERILINLGINLFAAKEICAKCTSYQFLTMTATDRYRSFYHLLTEDHLNLVTRLMSLSW
ncbi:Zip2p Ecym_6006 [Eremothecium cymbalariae DBVPG|uniref:Uncharacterized protein n=1 Tax=Eremothecium cymbalariae (strain CBS 270.75 / DBVPG 7215 / KCTC 17166 / NRRL Y-17582) TaxID=931890 RepID=G8JUT5_ERECY|nr:hypothetical protein Ecym_6006 [Eremothecium cymbalariae DBVPG\